jgi:hypothetical protein
MDSCAHDVQRVLAIETRDTANFFCAMQLAFGNGAKNLNATIADGPSRISAVLWQI